jgi:hypothetical protein
LKESSLLLLGFLSLCQITFLPGYLGLRVFNLPVRGLLQTVVYSFALTLVGNHTLVYALFSAGLYKASVMYGIVALEWLGLFYLMRKEHFGFRVSLPSEETLARYRALWGSHPVLGRLILIPVFASLVAAVILCYRHFGSVFLMNDDVLSWDRWGVEWATSRPLGTGLYPQLLPTNFSITYLMLGNTDVKMFAKAIMPLFTLATLLLFLDLFHKTGQLFWLVGLSCYAFLLSFFFEPDFLASGYAEIASAFFAFMTLHASLQDFDASCAKPALVAIFASGTLLTKQGGVYVFALAFCWLVAHFVRLRDRIAWRTPVLILVAILLMNWRWVMTEWHVWRGETLTNIVYLTKDIHAGKTYPQRWRTAWQMIERARGPGCKALVLLIAAGVFLSLLHPHGRWVFLLMLAPFYVLWALFFSYDTRNLAMDIPFAADCFGCGAAVAAGFCQAFGRWLVQFGNSRRPRPAAPVVVAPARTRGARRKTAKVTTRTVEQRSRTEPVSTPGWLKWVLAALILSGGAAWFSDSLAHWVRTSRWLLDMLDAWKWPLVAVCGLATIAPLAAKRISPVRLHVPAAVLLLVSVGAIAIVQATILPAKVLIRDQVEKRKSAGVPAMNRKLYEYAQRKPLRGMIATDDYFIAYLPELSQYYRFFNFQRPATPEFFNSILADKEVRYLLSVDAAFPPSVVDWMSQHGFQTVFQERGYRFVELPAN